MWRYQFGREFLLGIFLSFLAPVWSVAQIRELPLESLLEQLSDSDLDRRRDAAYEVARRQLNSPQVVATLAKSLADDDIQVRYQALLALGRMGTAAEPAIEELAGCLEDRDDQVRYRAGYALANIGQPSLSKLKSLLEEGSSRSQSEAARALAIMGAAARELAPLLLPLVDAETAEVRESAAAALVAIEPEQEATILRLARHADAAVRRQGIQGLAAIPEPTDEVSAALQQTITDAAPEIRELSVIVLAKSQLPEELRAKYILAALQDDADSVCVAAAVAIKKANLANAEFAKRLAARLQEVELPQHINSIARALAEIGPPAEVGLPDLLQVVGTAGVDVAIVSTTIARLGVSRVPDLLRALEQSPDLEPFISAALADIGEPAISPLMESLTSSSEIVRVSTVRALGRIQPLQDAIIEHLIESARADESALVRSMAVTALTGVGSDPRTKAVVLQASVDSSADVRAAALQGLTKFQLSPEEMHRPVANGLADEAEAVQVQALNCVAVSKDIQPDFLQQVVELARTGQPPLRIAALQTLSKYAPESIEETTVAAVVAGLADVDRVIKSAATAAAIALHLRQTDVLDALSANLIDDPELLAATLAAIADFGPAAQELIPTASRLCAHPATEVRRAALLALAAIQTDRHALAARLVEVLEDTEWEVRREAAAALGKLGPDGKVGVPKLFHMLASDEDRDFARGALRDIDAAPVEAVPLFMAALDSEDRTEAFYAIFLLGKVGPAAAEALPKLEEQLNQGSSESGRSGFRSRFLRDAIAAIKGEPPSDD